MSEFYPFYKVVSNNTDFIPHYVTHSYDELEMTPEERESNCVAKGKYCLPAYPNPNNKNGKVLINEGLFHHCVYNASKQKEDRLNSFFEFISNFKVQCATVIEGNTETKCGRNHLSYWGVDEKDVSKCVSDSYDEDASDNKVLKAENERARLQNINQIPILLINTKKIYGALSAQNIFHTVCSSFTEQPTGCKEYYRPSSTKSSLGWIEVTLIILATIIVNVLIIYICLRYIKKRLQNMLEDNPLDLHARIQKTTSDYYSLQTQPNKL